MKFAPLERVSTSEVIAAVFCQVFMLKSCCMGVPESTPFLVSMILKKTVPA